MSFIWSLWVHQCGHDGRGNNVKGRTMGAVPAEVTKVEIPLISSKGVGPALEITNRLKIMARENSPMELARRWRRRGHSKNLNYVA